MNTSSLPPMPAHGGAAASRCAGARRNAAPWRGAVIAWSVALMLGGVLVAMHFVTDRGAASAGGASVNAHAARGPRPLFAPGDIPVDRVDRVVVRRSGVVLEFARTKDGWKQVTPFEQPADGALLRDAIVRASDLRVTREVAAATVNLASLGLEPPNAELEVEWSGGSHRWKLGNRGVAGRAWLRIDDGPALAVDPALHDSILEADPRRWRSWRLFERADAESTRIVVIRSPLDSKRAPERLELVRDSGRWRIVAPITTRADSRAVEALLSALARAEHSGFVDDDPKDLALFGLEHPIASVEVASAAQSERLEIGAGLVQGGALCARRSDRPPIVLLDRTALAALLPPPAALVDGRACELAPTDIRTLRVRAPDGSARFELVRTLDGWRLDEPNGRSSPARESTVASLLERLCVARAEALALQPMPSELQVATIEVVPAVGAPSVIRVAREKGEGKWALDESDDCLRVFPATFDPPLEPALFRGG